MAWAIGWLSKRPRNEDAKRMAADNLQTVIVSKETAKTLAAAKRVAREFSNRIYTHRETTTSWRFRQRPPEDFKKDSFRTKKIDGGVSLVYGQLKPSAKVERNPDTYTDEVRFMYGMERRARAADDGYDLAKLAREVQAMDLASMSVYRSVLNTLMERANGLKLKPGGYKQRGEEDRDRYFEMLLKHPVKRQRDLFENPKKVKKAKKRGTPRHVKLNSPKKMPDPGPCSWHGSILEWAWIDGEKTKTWKAKGKYWLFLWSPKYKAIVAVPCPTDSKICDVEKTWKKLDKVSRAGGAAKMFERFMEREATMTIEGEVPAVKLVHLGEGKKVVYRSNKWVQQNYKKHAPSVVQGRQQDYYHCVNEGFNKSWDLPKGAQVYCGPSLEKPEVFICFGGRLTMTERGLVF